MNNFLNGKSAAMMLALSLVNVTAAFAQDDNSSAKEEGNRNVMLNAASANGPREIQIGLPSADGEWLACYLCNQSSLCEYHLAWRCKFEPSGLAQDS